MTGQMCWLPKFGTDGTLILHLRQSHTNPGGPIPSLLELLFQITQFPMVLKAGQPIKNCLTPDGH